MRTGFIAPFRRPSAFIVALAALGLALSASAVAAQVTQADPVWLRAPAAGEWCWTYHQYIASLKTLAVNPEDVVCAEMGPCDNFVARDAAIPTPATPIKTYRLIIHVFCDDNGGNCAANLFDVAVAVGRLNTDYAPWRIGFVYETDFINDTKYRDLDVSNNTEPKFMKKAYAVSPGTKLNVYVVKTGGVSWGTFPWDPNALGEQGGIVMHEAWFVRSTPLLHIFTHEVGHCLGLWHTFHGVTEVPQCSACYEAVGRPPEVGDTTGDFCSETNPTTNTSVCSDPPDIDPCSFEPWTSTPWLNYMGYSNSCANEFKAQQAGRMHCWTTSVLTAWLCPSGTAYYRDADGDGFGNPEMAGASCDGIIPAGYVATAGDCNDVNASVHPGAVEICNGIDDDCDGYDNAPLPQPIASVAIAADGSEIQWAPQAVVQTYDVVSGDLGTLRSSGGDFTVATQECVASNTTSTWASLNSTPDVGQAYWLLVRGNNCIGEGTYDFGDPQQVGSRDAEIDASPLSCP
jgi:hypothetical protein